MALLTVVPLTLLQANNLVEKLHRHHKSVQGHRFSLGLLDDTGELIGAVVVGRPVARMTEQYQIAEVTRLVTDGTQNACSMLYGAAARVCKEMGFMTIQTFILDGETGVSLKAAGWTRASVSGGGDWNRVSKPNRCTDQPMVPKQKWIKILRVR